jgi:transposase
VKGRLVLSDAAWDRMAPLIIGRPDQKGSTGRDNRMFVEGVLWIVRTGSPWRDLPEVFGDWNSVFRRFSRQAIGRSRGGLSTKILRGLGCPVRFTLTAGQKGDAPQAAALIEGLPAEVVMADTASQPTLKRQPEITLPSSLSQLSFYGCDKCPHD